MSRIASSRWIRSTINPIIVRKAVCKRKFEAEDVHILKEIVIPRNVALRFHLQ